MLLLAGFVEYAFCQNYGFALLVFRARTRRAATATLATTLMELWHWPHPNSHRCGSLCQRSNNPCMFMHYARVCTNLVYVLVRLRADGRSTFLFVSICMWL